MKMKTENKIIALSITAGLLIWTLDAFVDTFIFNQKPFLKSLLGMSKHEIYFHCFMVLSLLFFGVMISRILARQREVEARYKNLVELSSDIIYTSDNQGKQTFMNDAAFRILERSPEEVIGHPMISLIHPDDRERTLEKRKELAGLDTDVLNFENRYITKSGKVLTVLHNVRILKDKHGKLLGHRVLREILRYASRRRKN
jgi:PAS domain S-box-containing protein